MGKTSVEKKIPRGQQILQRPIFKFGHVTTFFGYASSDINWNLGPKRKT